MESAYSKRMRSDRSGKCAEKLVAKVFNLREPAVEVKAVAKHNNHAVIKLSQLERSGDLDYIIVIYDRKCERFKSGKRKGRLNPTISIEEAFDHPVEFIVIPGHTLMRSVSREKFVVRLITEINGPSGSFYVYPPVSKMKAMTFGEPEKLPGGHVLYGARPRPRAEHREERVERLPLFSRSEQGEPPF